MLSSLRRLLANKFFGAIFFGGVILSMAFYGDMNVFSGAGGNMIKSGDRGISMQEFDRVVQDELRERSRQEKRAVTKAEAVNTGLIDQIYGQQISRLVTLGYAESIGARASTSAVKDEVVQIDAFKNQLTGEFDKDVYRNTLSRGSGGMSPARFEQDIRDQLSGNYVFGAAAAAIEPPKGLADIYAQYEGETRQIDILRLSAADIDEAPEPTEEELTTYYEQNKQAFGEPERRALTVLHFSPADFRHSVEISEETMLASYEAGKLSVYSTPQSRKFTEVFFATEAEALQALGSLAAGSTPDDLENAVSSNAREAQQADIANAEYASQLFGQAQGAIAGPVLEGDTWVIARIDEVIAGDPFPYADVKDQVRSGLVNEAARRDFNDAASELDNLIGEGLSLAQIGERIGAPAISFIPVDRQGATASRSRITSLLTIYQQSLTQSFELFEEEITERFDLEDGGIYIAQLDSIVPASTPELETVKDRVSAAWNITNQGEALTRFSEDVTRRINRGEATLLDEARSLSKRVSRPSAPFSRSGQNPEVPPSAITAAFTANNVGDVVTAPSNVRGEVIVLQLVSISPPDAETQAAFEQPARALVENQLNSDITAALGSAISTSVKTITNDGAYAAYKSRTNEQ